MIRNIRHIQIKKIAHHPKLYQAIITYEDQSTKHNPIQYDNSDDINYLSNFYEYIKSKDIEKNKKKIN